MTGGSLTGGYGRMQERAAEFSAARLLFSGRRKDW